MGIIKLKHTFFVFLSFFRKLHATQDKDVAVNAISGSNRKKQRTEEEDKQSDSEDSVHTSDMSSDEDEGEPTCAVQPNEINKVMTKNESNNENETKAVKEDKAKAEVSERRKTVSDREPASKTQRSDKTKAISVRKVVHVPVKRTKAMQVSFK